MISKHATQPVWICFYSLAGAAKVGHSLGMPNQAPAQLLPSRALSESFQDFLNLFQVGQSKSQRGRHAVIRVHFPKIFGAPMSGAKVCWSQNLRAQTELSPCASCTPRQQTWRNRFPLIINDVPPSPPVMINNPGGQKLFYYSGGIFLERIW